MLIDGFYISVIETFNLAFNFVLLVILLAFIYIANKRYKRIERGLCEYFKSLDKKA